VFSLWEAHRNGRLRRNLIVAARSGEGPFTQLTAAVRLGSSNRSRFADLHHSTEGTLDRSGGNEGGQSFREVLEILGDAGFPANQEKERSTAADAQEVARRILPTP
jgi:hypothetical protein